MSSSLRADAITRVPDPTVANRVADLSLSWKALVLLIQEPPAPSTRKCPSCGSKGLSAATRCGFCWVKLVPLA